MSGAAFEGLAEAVRHEDMGRYEPGSPDIVGMNCIGRLIDAYLREEFFLDYDYRREDAVRHISSELEGVARHEGFDANRFLDMLLLRLSQSAEDTLLHNRHFLVNPLLQALYGLGHNGFHVDLGEMPAFTNSIGEGLQGTPELPLELSLICMRTSDAAEWPYLTNDLCSRMEHCVVTVRGDIGSVGKGSICSEYLLDGSVRDIGREGTQCTYRLTNPEDAALGYYPKKNLFRRLLGKWSYYQVLSTVREGAHPSVTAYETYMLPDFYDRGNTLLIPDGAGSWKEVRP